MFVVIEENGMQYEYDTLDKVETHIQLIYFNDDVCMSEILANIEVQGLSLETAAELYMDLRNWTGDSISMIDEEGNLVL